MRMILASLVAVVVYNAYEAIAMVTVGRGANGIAGPVLAFMTGMFPQRDLRWLTSVAQATHISWGTAPRTPEIEWPVRAWGQIGLLHIAL